MNHHKLKNLGLKRHILNSIALTRRAIMNAMVVLFNMPTCLEIRRLLPTKLQSWDKLRLGQVHHRGGVGSCRQDLAVGS